MDTKDESEIVVYQTDDGAIQLRSDITTETIWATQAEVAKIFGVTTQNITMHLGSIYKQKELSEMATCKESLQVRTEGNRKIKRKVKEYNLDVIIAVGYRINSVVGTKFRQWATQTLKEHITKGYTVNPKQIAKNYDAFMQSMNDIQLLLPQHINLDNSAILDLIREFATTWVSLDAYDRNSLTTLGKTKKAIKLTGQELADAIYQLRSELIKKGEATELFAKERTPRSIEGIVGNVMQSFDKNKLYETVEEKAANLLYFIVKNHPFVDGNKRSGAFAFIWFLRKTKLKTLHQINPGALTALTIMIAESDAQKKEQMIGLIIQILK
jgi:prophage maintenance system killer protein